MALRDIFKFRELPETETSKPFLEHLEDLRWTVVKMAIALLLAMIVCFAFRSTLVRVMQAPLHGLDPQIGALKALGVTDSLVISCLTSFSFIASTCLSAMLVIITVTAIISPTLFHLTLTTMSLLMFFIYTSCICIGGLIHRLKTHSSLN